MTDKNISKLTKIQADIFKAVSHPTRLEIVKLLADGPLRVNDIVEGLNIEYANASRHLGRLHNVGMVSNKRNGTNIYYKLECKCVLGFLDCLNSFIKRVEKERSITIDEIK